MRFLLCAGADTSVDGLSANALMEHGDIPTSVESKSYGHRTYKGLCREH